MSNNADYDFAVPMPSQRKDERPASPAGNDERAPKSNHDQMGSSWSMGPVPNMMSSLGSSVSSEVTWNAMSSSHGNIDLNFQNHSTIAMPPYFDNGISVGNWNSMIPSPVVFDHSAVQQPFVPARTVQSYLNSDYASGSLGLFDSNENTIGGLPHWTYSSGLDFCSFDRSQQSTQPVSFAPNACMTPVPRPAPAQNSVAIDASGSSAFAHLRQTQMNNPGPTPFQAQRASFWGGWSARSTNQEQGVALRFTSPPPEASKPCPTSISSKLDASSALKNTQPSEHASLPTATRGRCDECRCIFVSQARLLRHCKAENHKPSQCICGESFSRPETLNRHVAAFIKKSGTRPDFTCTLCHRSGSRGFPRRDHLIQHLQVYHRGDPRAFRTLEDLMVRSANYRGWDKYLYLCPRGCNEDCDEAWITSWGLRDSKPFNGQQHFDLHMRHMHEELPYACSYSGCSVSGATTNGFKTESALEKHMSKEHRLAIEAQRREEFLPWCGERGCGLRLTAAGATWGFRCLESDWALVSNPYLKERGYKGWVHRETQ